MTRFFTLGAAWMTSSLIVIACGGGAATTGTGGAGAGSPTSSATGSMTSTGSTIGSCMPPCEGGKFCSVNGTCIDDGTCAGNGDCKTGGTVCDLPTMMCVPGGCNSVVIPSTPVAPNLLIVLDRSCSMTNKVGGTTKWDIAVGALDKLTTDFMGKIRFGLTLFPDLVAPSCAQDMIPIPVAPGTEMAIQMLLTASQNKADMYFPDGPCVTNIDTAVQQAATEPAFGDKTRSSYALLLTDGMQAGCNLGGGNAGTLATIGTMAQQGVHTFVIGFGGQVDVKSLDSFAVAGLEPDANGPHMFYDATDQATLDATFQAIASKTIGCVFQLMMPPQDPSQIYAFFDNVSVPRDPTHMNGWDYDPKTNQVTFYGPACNQLKMGSVTKVDVVYGCNAPPM